MRTCNSYMSAVVAGAAAVMLSICGPALAGMGEVEIGEEMPDFTMTDYTGAEHSLSDYRGKVVVLEFLSQHCPWSRGAAPSIADVAEKHGEDVVFLGIDSHRATTHADNAAYAEKMDIQYPILRDENNVYADKVGATRTPELYVIDEEGVLRYHGAYDNRKSPQDTGDVNYLAKAIDAVVSGEPVEKAEVSAWGCTIKRVAKRPSASDTD